MTLPRLRLRVPGLSATRLGLNRVLADVPTRTRVVLVSVAVVAVLLTVAQIVAPWWPGWPAPRSAGGARVGSGGAGAAYAGWTHAAWAVGRLAVVGFALVEWLRWRESVRWRAGLDLRDARDPQAWPRLREGSTAVLLIVWGLVGLSAGLGAAHQGVLMVWGFLAAGALVPALFAHTVLTFPNGRPRDRWQRLFLTAAYGSVLLYLGYALTAESSWIVTCAPAACPENPLLVYPSLDWSWVSWYAQKMAAIGVVAWLGALLLDRLRTDPAWRRRALVPVLAAATLPAVAFVWRLLLDVTSSTDSALWTALRWTEVVADLAVPAAMLVGLRVSGPTPTGMDWSNPPSRWGRLVEEAAMTSPDSRPLTAIPVAAEVGQFLDNETPEETPDPREVRHTVPPVDEDGNVIENADPYGSSGVAADEAQLNNTAEGR